MTQRLMGKNLDGSASGKSIPNLMADFLKRDRFVYVGRSTTTHVELNQKLFFQAAFGRECWRYGFEVYVSNWEMTPDIMARNPLNEWQVNSLIEYCNAKNVTVFDFLFNQSNTAMRRMSRFSISCSIRCASRPLWTCHRSRSRSMPSPRSFIGYISTPVIHAMRMQQQNTSGSLPLRSRSTHSRLNTTD